MQAELTIRNSATALEKFVASDLYITIAHQARGPAGPAISWLALAERYLNNVVRWDPDALALYMTNTLPFPGETIRVQHAMHAQLGWTYTFDGNGFFGFPEGPADVCTILNPENPNLFFGLAYRAQVNFESILAPINVAQLPNGRGEFAPGEEVTVFLAHSPYSGSVVPSQRAAVTVKPNANLVFDDATSMFRRV